MKKYLVVVVLFYTIISNAQDATKSATSIFDTCPPPYGCVKVDLPTQTVLSTLPLDKPMIVYGKIIDNSNSGKLNLKKRLGNNLVIIESSELSISDGFFSAKIETFLSPNQAYKLEVVLENSLSAEDKATLGILLLQYFVDSKDELDVSKREILRKAMIDKIPPNLTKYIEMNGFFDKNNTLSNDLKSFDAKLRAFIKTGLLKKNIFETKSAALSALLISDLLAIDYDTMRGKLGEEFTNRYFNMKLYPEGVEGVVSGRFKFGVSKNNRRLDITLPDELIVTDSYLSNLEYNIDSLFIPLIFHSYLDKSYVNKLNDVKSQLEAYKSYLELNSQSIGKIFNTALATSTRRIINLGSASHALDIQTTTEFRVVADVGALAINLNPILDGFNKDYRVIPYLGLNFYFSPINKETPIKQLFQQYKYKAFWKVFSVHAGITIPKISTIDKVGIYGIDDSRGFLAGVGLRPFKSFRLNYGWMFINRNIGNTLAPNYQIGGKPYFSIALDWQLRSIIPSVQNLFK